MAGKLKIILNLFHNYFRLFFTLLFIHILEISIAQSQRQQPYFSTFSELSIIRGNQKLLTGDFNGDNFQDICAYNSNIISILYNSKDSSYNFNTKYYNTATKIHYLVNSDVNNDNIDDLLMLSEEKKSIRVLLGTKQDTLVLKWKLTMDDTFDKFVVEDLNKDGLKDIILLGKKNLGLTVLTGRGDGTFKFPKTILQDYSFSDVAICNCSYENFPDIYAINWVFNQILYFPSYAPMRFLLPSVLSFDNEPISVYTTCNDNLTNLIVLFEDKTSMKSFISDNMGNFILKNDIRFDYPIDKYFIADVSSSGNNNLIVFSTKNKTFSIRKSIDDIKNGEAIYSTFRNPSDFAIFNLYQQSFTDILVSSSVNRKITIVQNANYPIKSSTDQVYITTPNPMHIIKFEAGNNSNVLITYNAVNQLGIFSKKDDGIFSGQISTRGKIDKLKIIKYINEVDGNLYFVSTHNTLPSVNILKIDSLDYNIQNYPVSGLPNPNVLYASMSKQSKNIFLYISSDEDYSSDLTLYQYQQIGAFKFREKSINSLGAKIRAVNINDINNDGNLDFLYLKETAPKYLTIYCAFTDSNNNIRKTEKYISFIDTTGGSYQIRSHDLNRDNYLDLIIYSSNNLELNICLYSTEKSLYPTIHQKFSKIKINSEYDIQICDFDVDNNLDILIRNIYTNTLEAYFGSNEGKFSSPEKIMNIYGINGFLVDDFNNDNIPDISLIYDDGYLRIIFGTRE